jgi:hypothetical protein
LLSQSWSVAPYYSYHLSLTSFVSSIYSKFCETRHLTGAKAKLRIFFLRAHAFYSILQITENAEKKSERGKKLERKLSVQPKHPYRIIFRGYSGFCVVTRGQAAIHSHFYCPHQKQDLSLFNETLCIYPQY